MERELQHFSHKEHPLILKAEERKINDGADHSHMFTPRCGGCYEPISGPFYTCAKKRCPFYLHKVCAELPNEMNHPLHPLTIGDNRTVHCEVCNMHCWGFAYHCSLCEFGVDINCAIASHTIEDQCHMHPLSPLQHPTSLPCCHICQTQDKGFSYKCTICPFWVHQNCTILLPSTVKHSLHDHLLTLSQSVPREFKKDITRCDICHDPLFMFHCVYYCEGCMFFAHVSCARSKEAPESSSSRDQNIDINQDVQSDAQRLAVLPVQQQSTDLISWFVENYSDRDPITNLILGFAESYIDRDTNIKEEINFFDHRHPLFLIDDQVSEEICDACAHPISPPSYYGCVKCGYFLHECCTELPKQILHPAHPEHQIRLWPCKEFVICGFCNQHCNGFVYTCLQCEDFYMDIKCASLFRPVKHEAHRHPLIPRFTSLGSCGACEEEIFSDCGLKCITCSFNLCFRCAMAPPIMIHRYDKHPFVLTYSPPENHYNEYICDLCEEDLNPKLWHYHCHPCDQFEHVSCMLKSGVDSNIKCGKTYKSNDHEHKLTLVRCIYEPFRCSYCRLPLMCGFSVALECVEQHCKFRIHLLCALDRS